LRLEVAHHVTGAVDLERHGDALFNRVRNLTATGGDIAAEVRGAENAPQHSDAQRRNDQLLDHGNWPPKMARNVARADVSGSLSSVGGIFDAEFANTRRGVRCEALRGRRPLP